MTLKFAWKPKNTPVLPKGDRISIGLELGGDDTKLADGTDGTIELFEVSGTKSPGGEESSTPVLIATFHGTFHRDPKQKKHKRITFELHGQSSGLPHDQFITGFDPECIIGVDAFVVTFLNREFQINLPFFVDSLHEGKYLEIQAVAKTSARTLGKSAVLNLKIRRNHEVHTTSNTKYTGDLVGNIVLHHEQYLVSGIFKNRSASWPSSSTASSVPVPWTGTHAIPFHPYTSGSLRILLTDDLLGSIVPDKDYVKDNVGGVKDPAKAVAAVDTHVRARFKTRIKDIFDDAGLAGAQVLWESDAAAAPEMTSLKAAFSSGRSGWTLRSASRPLVVPFWTFFVTNDDTMSSVGLAEGRNIRFTTTAAQTGNREYMLDCPAPIGSGDKEVVSVAKIRTSYFEDRLMGGMMANNKHKSLRDYIGVAEVVTDKVVVVIAHEIGHSIGLMHEVLVQQKGAYEEKDASPLLTIMANSVEDSSFGREVYFSNEAKVIWRRAFGVTPKWDKTLGNKTWGKDWKKKDWSTRKTAFMRLHGETMMTSLGLTTVMGDTPPFAGTGSKVQRGTYVP